MKTGKKNLWLIVSLSVAFVVSMFFGVYSMNSKKASAIDDGTFQMEGAAIRMDGVEGLRFGAVAAADVVASVNADSNKSFGAFIAPLDWMEYLNIKMTYSDSYDYYNEFKDAYAEVSTGTVSHNFNITPYKQRDDGSYELCITLKNVQYNNMSRTFFGLFCIVDNNGTPSDESDDTFTYANFSTNNQRSFAYVASAALTDTNATFTEAQKTNIYKTLQLAMYKKAGVSESTAKSNIAAGTYLEYELELNTSAVTLSAGKTYDIKASLVANDVRYPINDMVLKYTSSDTGVATVSNSGRITAVANGSATITVTYANPSAGVYYSTETVSVTVKDSVSYVAITDEYHNNFSVDIAQDNYSVSGTTNNNWSNQQDNGFVVQLDGGNNQTQVSFTITNNATTDSNNTLNAKVSIAVGASNMYNDEVELSSTTNGTIGAGRNNATNKGAIINSIAKGGHLNVTITLSSAFSGTNICLKVCPQYSNTTYDPNNTVTISNIYFGSGSAAPSGNAVNINSADNGSVTANVANAATGDKVYLTATPSTGYQLASLSVLDESENEVTVQANVFTMPNSAVTVSATFSKVTYSITNKVSDKISVASSAEYGDTVNLSAVGNGYRIVSVTYRANGSSTTIYTSSFSMPDSGVIITDAEITNQYFITVVGGTASVSTAAAGASVSITAGEPAEGKEFANWSASPSVTFGTATDASTTFTMPSSDVTITANYSDIVYTVTVNNGTASGTATYGSTITITANAAPSGKEFDCWTGSVSFVDATSSTTTFPMPANDVEVTATYKDAPSVPTLTVVSSGVNDTSNIETVSNSSTEAIYNSKKDWSGQDRHYGYAKVKCTTADVTTITFKIYNQATGNSNNTLNLYAAVRDSVGSQNDLYDNNAKTISSVTGGSVSGGNKAHFSSISKGNSATVSITLANSISQNTEFYIIFASMIDNGGFVGNFKIEFAEPVYYTVTNSVNTITVDKASATEGDTVTLTPKDNTKVVTAFNYTPAGGSATDVSGNTLTMPAKAVTINSVTLGDKPSGTVAYITAVGGWESSSNIAASNGNTTATLTYNEGWGGGGQEGHIAYVTLNNANGKSTLTFDVSTNGAAQIDIAVLTNVEHYAFNNGQLMSGTTIKLNGTTLGGGSKSNSYKLVMDASSSGTITITFSSAINTDTISFMVNPHMYTGYTGPLVMSNFLFN